MNNSPSHRPLFRVRENVCVRVGEGKRERQIKEKERWKRGDGFRHHSGSLIHEMDYQGYRLPLPMTSWTWWWPLLRAVLPSQRLSSVCPSAVQWKAATVALMRPGNLHKKSAMTHISRRTAKTWMFREATHTPFQLLALCHKLENLSKSLSRNPNKCQSEHC